MKEIDLDNCKECKESRCIMSKYYGMELKAIQEYDKEIEFQKRVKAEYNRKIKAYYLSETKYWNKFKDREMSMIKPDRDGHYNVKDADTTRSNWMHDSNWFIGIQKLMELQEQYYNSIKY